MIGLLTAHPSAPQGLAELRRLWAHDKALDGLKVALAFAGVISWCLHWGHETWLVGLILGVIAAALAETPERVGGRLLTLCVTLCCFALAAFSVRWLFYTPWLFAAALVPSTFALVMLGALGERYAAIGSASLILAVYTMLGISQHGDSVAFWHEPFLLLGGAAFYGLISLAAAALFPNRPVRQILAQLFVSLADYLMLKADIFEPFPDRNLSPARVALATHNGRIVGLMNRARQIILLWVQARRPARGSLSFLHWYLLAQEVHERASSAHQPYEALARAFARSDVMFRIRGLMRRQSSDCRRLATAIAQGEMFLPTPDSETALRELQAALAWLQANPRADSTLLEAIDDIVRNLAAIQARLARAGTPGMLASADDATLRDAEPRSLTEMFTRLRAELTPDASRLRHALRLSAAMGTGYVLLQLLNLPQGYWVMLTTIFVCQPSFSSTWRRLGERVSGTLAGLFGATLFIAAFPHPTAQLALLVVAGVLFFALRTERYGPATACITILVMVCFNQFGASYALVWPRLLDTVLGCLLAAAAVAFILPDWQGRRVPQAMARTLEQTAAYLSEVLAQYHAGKRDDLPYRIARRGAHNADAALSTTLASMRGEPDRYSLAPDAAYRFLCASHLLLGHVSALGAHRERLRAWQAQSEVAQREDYLVTSLAALGEALRLRQPLQLAPRPAALPASTAGDTELRLLRQLELMIDLLPELATLSAGFALHAAPAAAQPTSA